MDEAIKQLRGLLRYWEDERSAGKRYPMYLLPRGITLAALDGIIRGISESIQVCERVQQEAVRNATSRSVGEGCLCVERVFRGK